MRACIVAVGTEMLTPFRVDTNSLFVTERLNEVGIDVRLKLVAGDDVDELAELLRAALGWADLIVMTGGLGPTEDDITRAAVARLLQVPLDLDETIVDRIRDRFQRRGMAMPEINKLSSATNRKRCSRIRAALASIMKRSAAPRLSVVSFSLKASSRSRPVSTPCSAARDAVLSGVTCGVSRDSETRLR